MNTYSQTQIKPNQQITPMLSRLLQRKCICGQHTTEGECKECNKKNLDLQRNQSNNQESSDIPEIVYDTLGSLGQPLDRGTRHFMESRFGRDFSQVRVHTDKKATKSAHAINALAYTVGNNIVFGSRQFAPKITAGKQLLAHELTHVVQQSSQSSPSTADLRIKQDSAAETEATQTANLVASGGKVNQPIHSHSSAIQKTEPKNPRNRDFNLPKLTISPEIKAMLFAQCASGNLRDPALCAQLQLEITRPLPTPALLSPPSTSFGLAPQLELGRRTPDLSPEATSRILADIMRPPLTLGPQSLLPSSQQLPLAPRRIPLQPQAATSSLSELLSFSFQAGPVQFAVELPKRVEAKLPIPLRNARSLAFSLQAESSGNFSFSITLNGLRHVTVAARAGVNVDKDKGVSGSAGLDITTTRTVCNAENSQALRSKIIAAGNKIKKAPQESDRIRGALSGTDATQASEPFDFDKLVEIAEAIGEMYDAVEKSKSGCTQVPVATLNFGTQQPISPSDAALNDPDPTKRLVPSIGLGFTFHF